MADISRRAALAGGVALTAAAGVTPASAADPRGSADGQIKMEACLDGHPAI